MAEKTFDIDKAQEQIITDTLQIIRDAFNLKEWKKIRGTRDGTLEYRYYLYENAIWEQTGFTPLSMWEYPLEELGITKYSYHQIAQSIDGLVATAWFSELSDLSRQYTERKMQEFFSVDSDDEMVRIHYNNSQMFLFPKSFILSNHYPVSGEVNRGIFIALRAEILSKKQILQCIFSHNQYQQEFYKARTQYCKKIYQFIRDHRLNEKLNLESPPFSPELYKIHAPIILDYQNFISPFHHPNRSLP